MQTILFGAEDEPPKDGSATADRPTRRRNWRQHFFNRSVHDPKKGICHLAGAGPGDPGLLTLKARECLERADVVVYDYLCNPEY